MFILFIVQLSWSEVRREMIEEKSLDENIADKIGEYIQLFGHTELIEKLQKDDFLNKIPSTLKGLADLKLLLNYCNLLGIQDNVIIDLSLARGLDYYTGVILEATLKGDSLSSNFVVNVYKRIKLNYSFHRPNSQR